MSSNVLLRIGARLREGRTTLAALLLGTLVVGATFHELHHLQDPTCGTRPEAAQHFCPCSGLHAPTLGGAALVAPDPVCTPTPRAVPLAVAAPAIERPTTASPRAPPHA